MELMALLKEFSLNPIWPVITLNLRFNIALERDQMGPDRLIANLLRVVQAFGLAQSRR